MGRLYIPPTVGTGPPTMSGAGRGVEGFVHRAGKNSSPKTFFVVVKNADLATRNHCVNSSQFFQIVTTEGGKKTVKEKVKRLTFRCFGSKRCLKISCPEPFKNGQK